MFSKHLDAMVLLAGFMLLACLVKSGSAIMCHNCTSVDDSKCMDPFNKDSDEFLVNCTEFRPDATLCRKIDQTVNGIHRIFRRCAWEEHKRYDCYFGTSEYYKSKICVCREDGCNHASSISVPAYLILATFAIWIIRSSGFLQA